MSISKIRFVVIDGLILGYINPRVPLSANILRALRSRGAICGMDGDSYPLPLDPEWVRSPDCPKPLPLDGSHPIKLDSKRVRPATRADFDVFNISCEGYVNDAKHYEPLAA
jgi:hypothetical protein